MNFRIGKGRSAAEKKSAGEAIFAAVTDHLSSLFVSDFGLFGTIRLAFAA